MIASKTVNATCKISPRSNSLTLSTKGEVIEGKSSSLPPKKVLRNHSSREKSFPAKPRTHEPREISANGVHTASNQNPSLLLPSTHPTFTQTQALASREKPNVSSMNVSTPLLCSNPISLEPKTSRSVGRLASISASPPRAVKTQNIINLMRPYGDKAKSDAYTHRVKETAELFDKLRHEDDQQFGKAPIPCGVKTRNRAPMRPDYEINQGNNVPTNYKHEPSQKTEILDKLSPFNNPGFNQLPSKTLPRSPVSRDNNPQSPRFRGKYTYTPPEENKPLSSTPRFSLTPFTTPDSLCPPMNSPEFAMASNVKKTTSFPPKSTHNLS